MKSFILFLPALSIATPLPHQARQDEIDDTFFYSQSPPVYPSPETQATDPTWIEALAKAKSLVSRMTIEEKANITVGVKPNSRCSGQTGSVPRLNFPSLCTTGAGNGIRQTDLVNGWPSGIHVGASFNRNLTHQRGYFMGEETRKKGSNALGGPVMGPLGRLALHGRNWEGFSNDPYLAGQLSGLTVQGIQEAGVMTMSKHYVGYEQQTLRLAKFDGEGPNATLVHESISANMDDRTLHEVYVWPFADAVRAGASCIMCSYNRLNNSYACQNSRTLNGILKTELGFPGWVVSDWGAQMAGVGSALAGLDMAMPDSDDFWGRGGVNLAQAVRNGSVPESRLDDMVVRIVTPWYALKQDMNYPSSLEGMPTDFTAPRTPVYAKNPKAKNALFQSAIEGQVLVKNIRNALPLTQPRMVSIFGYDAQTPVSMNVPGPADPNAGSSALFSNPWTSGFLGVKVENFFPIILGGTPGFKLPSIAALGTLVTGGGSGATAPSYISSPFDAISQQAWEDNTAIFYDFNSTNPYIDSASDACLVFINAWATEGMDRPELHDDYSDSIVLNVASKCNNTIVVVHNAGVRLIDMWVDHPNVTAIVFAHLPGQDSGRAIVSVLYGHVSPSGRLPYTVAKNESDYGNLLLPAGLTNGTFAKYPQDDFDEGIFIDYKHFDKYNITPRYEFGFGLSYTTFEYTDLEIEMVSKNVSGYMLSQNIAPGGNPALYEVIARIHATVHNVGQVDSAEVSQLYLGIPAPDTPTRQLRGFEKHLIPKGSSERVVFELRRKDLSVWDVVAQDWVIKSGDYNVFVGRSSRDLPLAGVLKI